MYRGDFLSKLSSEPWVMAVAAHYRNLYLQVVQESMVLLEQQDRPEDAARLGRQALAVDPYQEDIYRHLLRILLALGQKREVIALYEDMCKKFLASFDAPPAEDIRDIYRQAVRVTNERAVSMETVQEQLRERDSVPGALVCEYDFFCALYQAMARSIVRTGDPAHICLLSVTGKDGKSLAKRSLERAMQNLEEVLRRNLRRGDVVAKCSVSQFVLLLPRANYENSCGVYNRLVKTFLRQYPHSPAELQGTVRPVEPNP
jgi:tetratricopeptide (TPR) repeat protein